MHKCGENTEPVLNGSIPKPPPSRTMGNIQWTHFDSYTPKPISTKLHSPGLFNVLNHSSRNHVESN